MALFPTRFVKSFAKTLTVAASALTLAAIVGRDARAAEPAACLSQDPTQWPAPSKPYFMIIVDNSGSMTSAVTGAPSCAGFPSTRNGHARCAVQNAVSAYAGEVDFGLMTYTERETACAGACFGACTHSYAPGDSTHCGPRGTDPGLGGTNNISRGGYVVVPMLQDHYWMAPPSPSNVPALQALVDNSCAAGNGALAPDNTRVGEIGAQSNTPLAGSLFAAFQYFSDSYIDPFNAAAVHTPIGTTAVGERGCRPINVILLTDGDETCDCPVFGGNACQHTVASPTPIAGGCHSGGAYPNVAGEAIAAYEADKLFHTGVTPAGSSTFNVKTYVIGFAGANTTALDSIATCGGTTSAFSTANETQISLALSGIISSAIKPETCDNTDNNCNGCTDEGFTHYCDVQPVPANCCAWTTDAQRNACLNTYTATITTANPNGDQSKLPCTTVAQAKDPGHWLCYNPGERCDNVDNNCEQSNGVGTVDDGVTKCGSPLHCPQAETCNGQDDDCDGVIDNGGVCGACTPSSEVCDGCDNNCNRIIDDGAPDLPCGFSGPGEPAYCAGTQTCKLKGTAVATAGQCLPGGGYSACQFSIVPPGETCNGLDDDCNGIVDDGIPSIDCVPPGTPGGLVYDTTNPSSICHKGHTVCTNGTTTCVGFVGPQAEVCDGLDNNCDGTVDNAVPGVGLSCGVNQPPCTPGHTACVNGSLVCQGGVMPQPEICDGIDNNCNGQVDESPLVDAPPGGMNGCWDLAPTNCPTPCQFPNPAVVGGPAPLKWCPPPGATCNDLGVLTTPCHTGTLSCHGTQGWSCSNDKEPTPEVCDGIDNNCNGLVDDGNVQNVGQNCGIDGPVEPDNSMGPCRHGTLVCNAGVLSCVGGVGPTMEVCDGIDNDCNGLIDDGLPIGDVCTPDYDHAKYPGDRTAAPCQPGHFQCDGMGHLVCGGGVGPTPEVCDGIDNDCDGQVDEVGAAPDGINGTENPNPPPAAKIGDTCGVAQGACMAGVYACMNGQFYCKGETTGQAESCNCQDDDCDGHIDNKNPGDDPPLCSAGKDCVKGPAGCQCAKKGCPEVGCPPGQECSTVTDPDDATKVLGKYCVTNPNATCGDCSTKTTVDKNGKTICAPAGTVLDNCVIPPVCVCQGQAGCQDPCLNVMCGTGQVCAETGAKAGKCVDDNCFNVPCQGCGKACNLGSCVATECSPNPCPDSKPVCVPTFPTGHKCEKSCAGVDCPSGQKCEEGSCKKTCEPACAKGKYCDESGATPKCVDDPCPANGCSDGSCCDHKTGSCGQNCPCDGVVCPDQQVCKDDSCVEATTGSGGGSSSSSSGNGGGDTTASGTGTTQPSGAGGAGAGNNGVFGLATGGGGCQCDFGDDGSPARGLGAALVALAIGLGRRRRRSEDQRERGAAKKEVRS